MNPHIRSQSPLCYPYTIPLDTFVIIPCFMDLSRVTGKYFSEKAQRSEALRASSFCCCLRFFLCRARITL